MADKVDIDKLALLARIKLDSKEKEKLQKEFEAILGYVSKLKEVDVEKVSEFEASKIIEFENVFREDEESLPAGRQAPSVEKGYVKVKRILE